MQNMILTIDRIGPPQTWNVEKRITLTLDPMHTNKILKCVAMVNKETLMKKEMSYKLTTFKNSMMSGTAYPSRAPEFINGQLERPKKGLNLRYQRGNQKP
jgi:hypothetical protein